MKIDVNKLEKAIDNTTTICEKGRADIKKILSEGFGVEFESWKELRVKTGDRVRYKNDNSKYIVVKNTDQYRVLVCLKTGLIYTQPVKIVSLKLIYEEFDLSLLINGRSNLKYWEKLDD